ncbi:hypothetical protein Tco_1390931 [Tanacetum coccineum]
MTIDPVETIKEKIRIFHYVMRDFEDIRGIAGSSSSSNGFEDGSDARQTMIEIRDSTDIAKITRKRSKPDKHEHGNE